MTTRSKPRPPVIRSSALAIELTCRLCRRPYQPTREDIAAGPETYHRCPQCRPPAPQKSGTPE